MLARVWSLLLLLIASSLVVTATVHAREVPGAPALECSGVVHSDHDADQSEGDSDKAVPHHHSSCHAQMLSIADESIAPVRSGKEAPAAANADAWFRSNAVEPGLRPPAA